MISEKEGIIMANRSNKKFQKIELFKELHPEEKSMLENRKKQLTKKYKEHMKHINKLLEKPVKEIWETEKQEVE